jgi:hypothetical protein
LAPWDESIATKLTKNEKVIFMSFAFLLYGKAEVKHLRIFAQKNPKTGEVQYFLVDVAFGFDNIQLFAEALKTYLVKNNMLKFQENLDIEVLKISDVYDGKALIEMHEQNQILFDAIQNRYSFGIDFTLFTTLKNNDSMFGFMMLATPENLGVLDREELSENLLTKSKELILLKIDGKKITDDLCKDSLYTKTTFETTVTTNQPVYEYLEVCANPPVNYDLNLVLVRSTVPVAVLADFSYAPRGQETKSYRLFAFDVYSIHDRGVTTIMYISVDQNKKSLFFEYEKNFKILVEKNSSYETMKRTIAESLLRGPTIFIKNTFKKFEEEVVETKKIFDTKHKNVQNKSVIFDQMLNQCEYFGLFNNKERSRSARAEGEWRLESRKVLLPHVANTKLVITPVVDIK